MPSGWVGLPQVVGIAVSGCVALSPALPEDVVTWFVTGVEASRQSVKALVRVPVSDEFGPERDLGPGSALGSRFGQALVMPVGAGNDRTRTVGGAGLAVGSPLRSPTWSKLTEGTTTTDSPSSLRRMISQTPRILLDAVEAFVAFIVAEFRQR